MAYSNNEIRERKSDITLLAIDTSSRQASMAVWRGGEALSSRAADPGGQRSDAIMSDLDILLRSAGVGIKDVDAFAACVGPGSFTGLRIGLAAVKGLAVAAGKPVVGVTSLEAVAALAAREGRVVAMIKAYKGEIYTQLFSVQEGRAPVAESAPNVTTSEVAVERAAGFEDVVFAGDGAVDSLELIEQVGGSRFAGVAGGRREGRGWVVEPFAPLAGVIAGLAMERFLRGEVEAPETLRACYVRPSEAEIKLSQGLLGSKIRRSAGRE